MGSILLCKVFESNGALLTCQQYSSKITTGVYQEDLPQPIFFQTFVPLIFDYVVPSYKSLDVTLRDWREKCVSDSFTPSYTCPVFFHFERFLERFEQEVVPSAWTVNGNYTGASPMNQDNDLCNRIQKHFSGSLTSQYAFEEYIEKLRLCPISELRIKRDIPDYIYNIKALFKKMNENYENEFSNKFFTEANKKIGPAFYVNAVTSHQNGMLLGYLVEKTRWSQAALSCNNQRIPEFLVKPQNFSSAVGDLKGKLGIGGHIPSVPLEEVSAYYSLPLADCSYIEHTGNFVVQVSVPVIRKDLKLSLVKFHTVPFVYEETKNGIKDRFWCQMNSINQRYIVDESNNLIYRTDCKESNPLCQLEEYKDVSSDLCVRSIISNSSLGVRKHCSFDCVPLNDTYGSLSTIPTVQRVASDTWVFTGGDGEISKSSRPTASPETMPVIKCSGRRGDETVEIPSFGALEVKLPCECRLEFKSELFFTQSPCVPGVDSNPTIRHIAPVHFYQEETLSKAQSGGTDKIIFNLPRSDNFFEPESIQRLDGTTQKRVEEISSMDSSQARKTDEGPQLGALWFLVILQLIVIVVLVSVAIYKYVKERREISYSKERLVYNVYTSPSNSNIVESIQRIENANNM